MLEEPHLLVGHGVEQMESGIVPASDFLHTLSYVLLEGHVLAVC